MRREELAALRDAEMARNMFVAGLLLTVLLPVDLLMAGSDLGFPFVARVVIIAACFGSAWSVSRNGKWRVHALSTASACCAIALALLADHAGPSDLVALMAVVALPVGVALVVPGLPLVTIVTGLTATLGVIVVVVTRGATSSEVIKWAEIALVFTALGVAGSFSRARANKAHEVEHGRLFDTTMQLHSSEARRTQSERLAMVGQLAAGVAHEVNNPLAFIRANIAYLKSELPNWPLPQAARDEAEAVFEETETGIERITSIVRDLKSLATADPEDDRGPLSPVELRPIVDEAVRMAEVRLKKRVTVHVNVIAGVSAMAQPRQLVQVLLNLLINSADALEGQTSPPPEVWVSLRSGPDGSTFLAVDDNGPGISPDLLAKLFQPFFTTKPVGRGTGLGLAWCREHLRGVGSDLVYRERKGGGASFEMSLAKAPGTATDPVWERLANGTTVFEGP